MNATVIYRFQCSINGRQVDCDMCCVLTEESKPFFVIVTNMDDRELQYTLREDKADDHHFVFADDEVPTALKVAEYTLSKAITEYVA